MGKPVVGEVVVLLFPQTDLKIGKRRPALVVADIHRNDLILCQITITYDELLDRFGDLILNRLSDNKR